MLVVVVTLAGACSGGDDGTTAPDATTTVVTDPEPEPVLTMVSLNVLHGLFCPEATNHCDAPNRVALLAQHVGRADCPDVVVLQEVAPWIKELVDAELPELCDGAYATEFAPGDGFDGLLTLSRLPFTGARQTMTLSGGLRAALRVEVDTVVGPVAIVNTHTGTGADDRGAGGTECAVDTTQCAPPCDPARTMFECQLHQLEALIGDAEHAIIAGDLNLVADAPPMQILYDAGFVDTSLAAGEPECDATTGSGCTSGRVDTALEVLQQPSAQNSVRVDYILLRTGEDRCDVVYGDATGGFADEPATDGPGGLAWVSDHTGVSLDWRCA